MMIFFSEPCLRSRSGGWWAAGFSTRVCDWDRTRRQLALIVPCNERGNASLFLDAVSGLPSENWSRDNASFVG